MKIKAEAAEYFTHSENKSGEKFSSRMEVVKSPHADHSPVRITLEELDRTDFITAKPDITRKAKSMARHHVGAALQQECEQACAIKINGVAMQ